MFKNRKRLLLCAVAAVALVLLAGCGWTSGSTFPAGEYNPANADPETVVQNWLQSMEFRETTNDQGQIQRLPENGRDFDLWLAVIDPTYLQNPTTGQPATPEDIDNLNTQWQATNWQVEFKDIVLELESKTDTDATVKISNGAVRYIGLQFFGTNEYKQDSFGDKPAEVYLKYYNDQNDPLKNIPEVESKAVPRWVVVGGLDLGENQPFGEGSGQ